MDDLLENQCYRLSYWRVGSDEINYRRFFDVNDLAALAMEREDVFEAAHALVLRLVAEGKVDGLRIDHPDGLYDPATYFRRLQDHAILARARQAFEADPRFQAADWHGRGTRAPRTDRRRGLRRPATAIAARRFMSWSKRSWDRASRSSRPGRFTAPAATIS